MLPDILEYLKSQPVCVIALEMMDGSPHAATVHFAHAKDPFTLIFKTDKTYRKSEPLLEKGTTRASVVIGSNEGDMRTLQMDGTARLLADGDATLREAYLDTFPKKKEKGESPNDLYFLFTPAWWRFTDWTGASGKSVRTSTDS